VERFVSETTYNVLMGTLNSARSLTHSLTHFPQAACSAYRHSQSSNFYYVGPPTTTFRFCIGLTGLFCRSVFYVAAVGPWALMFLVLSTGLLAQTVSCTCV